MALVRLSSGFRVQYGFTKHFRFHPQPKQFSQHQKTPFTVWGKSTPQACEIQYRFGTDSVQPPQQHKRNDRIATPLLPGSDCMYDYESSSPKRSAPIEKLGDVQP